MKLVELDPQWLIYEGRRVGFIFRSPTDRKWWQSCFVAKTPRRRQWDLIEAVVGNDGFQACDPGCRWKIAGGVENATFETITVTPSLDGSKGGLWHGFITNGQIVGGL